MRRHNHGRSIATGLGHDGGRARRWLGVPATLAALALVGSLLFVRRVVVDGTSMVPSLQPEDHLVVVRVPAWWRLRPGNVVAVRDPRRVDRLLVKRVQAVVGRPQRLVVVAGDNPRASTDSRTFGPVPRQSVLGLAVYRYSPTHRAGRIG